MQVRGQIQKSGKALQHLILTNLYAGCGRTLLYNFIITLNGMSRVLFGDESLVEVERSEARSV